MRPDEMQDLVIARLIQELPIPKTQSNPNTAFAYQEDVKTKIRVERFKHSFFVYKHGQLIQLISNDKSTIQRFFTYQQKFPVRSIDRCFSALLVGIILEHGLIDDLKNKNNILSLIKKVRTTEELINKIILVKIEQNSEEFGKQTWTFTQEKLTHFHEESNKNQTEIVSAHELGFKLSELPSFICKKFTDSETAQKQTCQELKPEILYVVLSDHIISKLKEIRDTEAASWQKAISLMISEIHTNRLFWRPHSPVPESQLMLVDLLLESAEQAQTHSVESPSASNSAPESSHSEHHEKCVLAQKPNLATCINFFRAIYEATSPNDEHTRKYFGREIGAFYSEFIEFTSNSIARSVYPALDILPLILSGIFSQQMSNPATARFECRLLLKAIDDANLTTQVALDQQSQLRSAFSPASNRFLYELFKPRSVEEVMQAMKNAAHSIGYVIFATLMTSWQVIEETIAIINHDKQIQISQKKRKRLLNKLKTMAEKLKDDLASAGGSLFIDSGWSCTVETIKKKLDEINDETISDIDLNKLSQYFITLELIKTEMTLSYQATTIHPWELGDEPGITTVFPAELSREFNNYLIHSAHHHRAATLMSATLALLGFCQVPYLKAAVSDLNHALTGKSFSETGFIALSNMMMGMLAFKIALMGTSMIYLRESLLMELLGFIQRDPWSVAVAAFMVYALGNGLISHPAIQITLFLSCDVKLSKTGLMIIYEMCIKELYESEKLAVFPYLEWALVAVKLLMILHSFVTKDPHRRPYPLNAMGLTAKEAAELINRLTADDTNATPDRINQNLIELAQMLMFDRLGERKEMRHYLSLIKSLPENLNKNENLSVVQKTLYQALVRPKLPIAANFVYQFAMALSYSTAFVLLPLKFFSSTYRTQYHEHSSTKQFGDIALNVINYIVNLSLLAGFIYWVHVYDSHAANHAEHHDMHHLSMPSTAECLDLSANNYNDTHHYHELVHTCFNGLLQCKLHHTPAFFSIFTELLKWLGTALITINAALLLKNWDEPFSVEGRRQCYDSLIGEAYRAGLSFLQSLYVFISYWMTLLDVSATHLRDAIEWMREKVASCQNSRYEPHKDDLAAITHEIQFCRDGFNTVSDYAVCGFHRLFAPSTRRDQEENMQELMTEMLQLRTASEKT